MPWPIAEVKRTSVSSFGMGGTNAHIVLEGVNKRESRPVTIGNVREVHHDFLRKGLVPDKKRLYAFSASDRAGLERIAKSLAEHLDDLGPAASSPEYLADLAYTLGEHRSKLSWKTTCLAENGLELSEKLESLNGDRAVRSTDKPRIGFVFTGQGAQWPCMVRLMGRRVAST